MIKHLLHKSHIKPYHSFIAAVCAGSVVIGLLVVTGWVFDIELFKTLLPGFPSMKMNTALCFTALGVCLYIQLKYPDSKSKLCRLLALMVTVVGLVSFLQNVLDRNFGIDQLLITDHESILHNFPHPGRMSPITSISFFLTGLGLLGISFKHKRLLVSMHWLLHAVTITAFIVLIGFMFNMEVFYTHILFDNIALHVALLLLFISVAATLLHPQVGLTGLFTNKHVGNIMANQLFWKLAVVVILLTGAQLFAHRYGGMDRELGIILFSPLIIVIILYIIWHAATDLNAAEAKGLEDLKIFLNATSDPLVIVNETGTIQLVNHEAEHIFGSREKLIGTHIENLIPDRYNPGKPAYIQNFFTDEETHLVRIEPNLAARTKDGTEIPVEVVLNPVKINNQKWVTVAVRDISHRLKAEELREKNKAQLAENQELESFAYIVSHDLKAPLRGISSAATWLEKDYGHLLDENALYYISLIKNRTARLDQLIKGILNYSKVGNTEEDDTEVNFNSLVVEVTDMLNTGSNVKVDVVTDLPVLHTSKTGMGQVFSNLIGNAISHSDKELIEIEIGATEFRDHWKFYIKDNGPGIDKQHHERIFHVFQTLKNRANANNSGIGLSIVKKIVEKEGGKIWVDSEVGKGSTFFFTVKK